MTAPTKTSRNSSSSSDTVSIDAATARLLADLLDESAERMKGIENQQHMLAPTISYYNGRARQIRDQIADTNGS